MKKNLILIILLFFNFNIFANSKSDYTLTLAISLTDCLNCNKTMYDLQFFKDKYNIRIVFQKEYQNDSSEIFKSYDFKSIADQIYWSDSLYEAYAPYNGTYVSIESKYQTQKYTLTIHDIESKKFLNFLANQNKNIDTLFKEYSNVTTGVSSMKFGNEFIGFNVPYKNAIFVYNLFNQKLSYKIEISDEVLRKGFINNNDSLPISQYDAQHIAMKAAGVPKQYDLFDFIFNEDTLLVVLNQRYFRYTNSIDPKTKQKRVDTSLEHNPSIVKYVKGQFTDISKFYYYIKSKEFNYSSSFNFHIQNGKWYDRIRAEFPVKNRTILATINATKKGNYALDPILYFYNHPYSNSLYNNYPFLFCKNTFICMIGSKIYSLETGSEIEQIDFMPTLIETNTSNFNSKAFLNTYFINTDFLWVAIGHNSDDKKLKIYKINRKTRNVETSDLNFSVAKIPILKFDPLNPNYLIYKNNDGLLIREKIFK